MLEQEEETEAGLDVTRTYKRHEPGEENPPENSEETLPGNYQEYRERNKDLKRARRDMYADHKNNVTDVKDVPIWEKYALSVAEAAQYFHLGETKLREIVRKDKYANYLLWNGGRVYFKRKLFEEYLDKEVEV